MISDVDAFVATRAAWHTLAERVLAPARHTATGRIGLRPAPGGFATPPFGPEDSVIAVTGTELRIATPTRSRSEPLSTLGAAAALVGVAPDADTGVYTATTAADPATRVVVESGAAGVLAAWFGFGQELLETWRTEHTSEAPSEIQLWPEHFDLALDLGPERGRANYGASPGDADHPLPYLYVGPWEPDDDPFWNAGAYARLGYADLTAADPLTEGLGFFAAGHAVATRKC